MPFYLPGSRHDNEPEDPSPAGLTSGRFTEQQILLIAELTQWWSNRRAIEDATEPLTTFFGGVDLRGTAQTSGTTPATITWNDDAHPPAVNGRGRAYHVHALGIPSPLTGTVYSLTAICHAYYSSGWIGTYTTIARAPAATTSTEILIAIDGGSGLPILKIIGVASTTINWTADAYIVEL